MSTLKVAAINNPSASSGGLAISASGNVTGAGLDLITTQSFSAASSVSINNCFSATYDNYRVLLFISDVSASDPNITSRLRAAGTDSTTGYSWLTTYSYSTSVAGGSYVASGAGIYVAGTSTGKIPVTSSIEIYRPFLAVQTIADASMLQPTSANQFYNGNAKSWHTATTSYDGFTTFAASGTITGSLSVYGYRK